MTRPSTRNYTSVEAHSIVVIGWQLFIRYLQRSCLRGTHKRRLQSLVVVAAAAPSCSTRSAGWLPR